MLLVRFSHTRCGDPDGEEYLVAPTDYNKEQIYEDLAEVQEEMIAAAKILAKGTEEMERPRYIQWENHKDRLVGDVFAEHKAKQDAFAEWEAGQKDLKKSFEKHFRERGYKGLWELRSDDTLTGFLRVGSHWGHNHGLKLHYKSWESNELGW